MILRAVRWFLLTMPIITIFFREHGLSMQEIFIIQSAFAVSVILFEIPTGYFSDVVGRKKSLIIGMLFGAIGLGVYSFSSGFWMFLIAELILWLGSSFISGTDTAMLYDTLLDIWKTTENKRFQWYFQSLSSISEAIAGFIGGFLATLSISLPFRVQFLTYCIFLPLAFFLTEPTQHKYDNKEWVWKWIKKIVKYSLHEHAEVKWLILLSWAFGASTLVMTWFSQSYFSYVGLPLALFWVIWTWLNLSLVVFSLWAHRLESYLGRKYSLFFLAFLPIVGYLLTASVHAIFGILFLLLFYFARGFGSVVLSDYVNVLIPSSIRATILSIQALVMRAIFALFWPILGWISDIYSLSFALFLSGVVFLVLVTVPLIFLARHRVLDI